MIPGMRDDTGVQWEEITEGLMILDRVYINGEMIPGERKR